MTAEKLLNRGRQLREQGKPWQAAAVFDRALQAASSSGDMESFVHTFADRAIVWRHLFEQTDNKAFGVLAKKDAETMLELVKALGVKAKLHTAYYMLGQAELLLNRNPTAVKFFSLALKHYKGAPGERGSWRYHLGKALYLTGQKQKGLREFTQAIVEITNAKKPHNSFLKHVYLSGAYGNLAFVLAKHDLAAAESYYKKAEKIILADKRLVVRKKQLLQLKSYLQRIKVG